MLATGEPGSSQMTADDRPPASGQPTASGLTPRGRLPVPFLGAAIMDGPSALAAPHLEPLPSPGAQLGFYPAPGDRCPQHTSSTADPLATKHSTIFYCPRLRARNHAYFASSPHNSREETVFLSRDRDKDTRPVGHVISPQGTGQEVYPFEASASALSSWPPGSGSAPSLAGRALPRTAWSTRRGGEADAPAGSGSAR